MPNNSTDKSNAEVAQMDWGQVAANGGPPCFHVEGPHFCGRAERWQGHGEPAFHNYVSLTAFITRAQSHLAEEVLAEMSTMPGGTHGRVVVISRDAAVTRIRLLLKRLNVSVEGRGE